MKFQYRLILLLFLALGMLLAKAQVTEGDRDQVYGFDPLLYNGRVYSFFPQPGTEGTQYIKSEFDKHGKITIRGNTFNDLSLNYDVYNQQLVLKYTNTLGSASLIEISRAWLEKFEIDGMHFGILRAQLIL